MAEFTRKAPLDVDHSARSASHNSIRTARVPAAKPSMERIPLPIDPHLDEISRLVREQQIVIVSAPTGAGKTLRVGPRLMQDGFRVVTTLPRIIATKSAALRASEENGTVLGEEIGYRTSLYRKDSPDTKLLYCTDGLELVRGLATRGSHRDVLIIDEIHEWNENMEVLLGWAKREAGRNKNFKLVVMSATLDCEPLKKFLPNAAVVEVEGRVFEVTERAAKDKIEDDIRFALSQGAKTILTFLPGKPEIEEVGENLRESGVQAEILPLHGSLSLAEQDRVFLDYDRPKIILSTSIAQTSLTIPGVDVVVDSGLKRAMYTINGLEELITEPISLADREQRKGRAGRTAPGIYVDRCPEELDRRPQFPLPEMLCIRPENAILQIAKLGLKMGDFELLHSPDQRAIADGERLLRSLGALDSSDHITPLGEEIAKLPTTPICGRMLVEGQRRGVLAQVIDAIAVFEAGRLLDREGRGWLDEFQVTDRSSDTIALSEVLRKVAPQVPFLGDSFDETALHEVSALSQLKARNLLRALETREKLRSLYSEEELEPKSSDPAALAKSIACGLLSNLHRRSNRGKQQIFDGPFGERVKARDSIVHDSDWVVGTPLELEIGDGVDNSSKSLLTRITQVQPSWLPEIAPYLVKRGAPTDFSFGINKDQVFCRVDHTFNGLPVRSEYIPSDDLRRNAETFHHWLGQVMTGELPKQAKQYDILVSAYTENSTRLQAMPEKQRPTAEQLASLYGERLGAIARIADIRDVSQLLI